MTAAVSASLQGQGVLSGTWPVRFPVSGYFCAVAGTNLATQPINAIVQVVPRLAKNQPLNCDSASVTLGSVLALVVDGVLTTVEGETVELVSNMPEFNLAANNGAASSDGLGNLIYDVSFVFGDGNQALAPFAFIAPIDASPICLTDNDFVAIPWQPPIQSAPLSLVGGGTGWRQTQRWAS